MSCVFSDWGIEIEVSPVSAIENGKLIDGKAKIMANTVSRYLNYYTEGFYKGRLTLSYHDMFNDGRGTGGSGGVILEDVKDVRIEGDYLIIEGLEGMPRPATSARLLRAFISASPS